MAKIANVAITNTFDAWRLRSNASFDRLSQFAINNSSLYANTITANVTFTSTGLATLSGRATVGTNLTVSGNTTLGAAGKTITTTGAAAHTGTKTISTNLTVSGNTSTNKATVTSLLTVSGNTNINNSGSNGAFSNTASIGVFSNNVNFSSKKIRNYTEDAMSYRNSSTTITLSAVRNVQRITLTGNATVTLPAGMPGTTEGIKAIVVIFKQDGTGSRTMAFAAPAGESLLYNNSATLPAVSSGATKVTIYVCTKFDGDARWYISQSFIEA